MRDVRLRVTTNCMLSLRDRKHNKHRDQSTDVHKCWSRNTNMHLKACAALTFGLLF